MTNVKLSPPWIKFYNEIVALFKNDPDVKVAYDEETYTIKLYVQGPAKADALSALLPAEKDYGNVVLKITVIPANFDKADKASLFRVAFEGNPALSRIESGSTPFTDVFNYVVFAPDVIQFFNDDIGSLHGLCTTLYQDIAKEVFGESSDVSFCTEDCRNATIIL